MKRLNDRAAETTFKTAAQAVQQALADTAQQQAANNAQQVINDTVTTDAVTALYTAAADASLPSVPTRAHLDTLPGITEGMVVAIRDGTNTLVQRTGTAWVTISDAVSSRPRVGEKRGGCVMTADDGDRTQLAFAQVANQNGWPFVVGLIPTFAGRGPSTSPDGRDYPTAEEWKTVASPYVELIDHSNRHYPAAEWYFTKQAYIDELLAAQQWFATAGLPYTRSHIYPLYSHNTATMQATRALGYLMSFVGGRDGGSPGAVNPRPVNMQRVYRYSITMTTGQITGIGANPTLLKRMMLDARDNGDLLVLCVHALRTTAYPGQEGLPIPVATDLMAEIYSYAAQIGLEMMTSARAAQVFGNVLDGADEDGRAVAVAGTGEWKTGRTRAPFGEGRMHRNAQGDVLEEINEWGERYTGHVLTANSGLRFAGGGTTPSGWIVSNAINVRQASEGILFDLPANVAGVVYQTPGTPIPPALRGRTMTLRAKAAGTAGRLRMSVTYYSTLNPTVALANWSLFDVYLDEAKGLRTWTIPIPAEAVYFQFQVRVEAGVALTDVALKQALAFVGNFNAAQPEPGLTADGGLLTGRLGFPSGGYMTEFAGSPSLFGTGPIGGRTLNLYDNVYISGRVWADKLRLNDRTAPRALVAGEFDSVHGVLVGRNVDNRITVAGVRVMENVAVVAGLNTIAHGLGHTPTHVHVVPQGNMAGTPIILGRSQAPDATNIYVSSSAAGQVVIEVG